MLDISTVVATEKITESNLWRGRICHVGGKGAVQNVSRDGRENFHSGATKENPISGNGMEVGRHLGERWATGLANSPRKKAVGNVA